MKNLAIRFSIGTLLIMLMAAAGCVLEDSQPPFTEAALESPRTLAVLS